MVLSIATHWNFNLSIPGAPQPVISSTSKVLPEYVPRRAVDMSHTSASSGYTDTEALMYADLAAGPAPSDSEVGSHTDILLTLCMHDSVKYIYSAPILISILNRGLLHQLVQGAPQSRLIFWLKKTDGKKNWSDF